MPYRYLEDIATSDAAFTAWGASIEELFVSAADATINVMVGDLATIAPRQRRTIRVAAGDLEMLLFELLQELIFLKDAELLLLRVIEVDIKQDSSGGFSLEAQAAGEELNPARHELIVDVKAVTLHRYQVARAEKGWRATVVLDI
jgi:SHS2 domain-containing protein